LFLLIIQFFYVLEGEGTMVFEDSVVSLKMGQGIEIPPKVKHQFMNQSNVDVHFLVISVPSTRGDRIDVRQSLPPPRTAA
jgi:mannose-6-phosphate isomerase-like protein (cupin superfamily)